MMDHAGLATAFGAIGEQHWQSCLRDGARLTIEEALAYATEAGSPPTE
jgi:hypothetical protein